MRLRLTDLALPLVAVVALVSACGGSSTPEGPSLVAASEQQLSGAKAHAPAPATSAQLSLVPDSAAARRRLGWVNTAALANAPRLDRAAITRAVLGDLEADGPTAIRVGDELAGPADPAPQTSAITPNAPATTQACLGDTLAQTMVGMGFDATLGVGIARTDDTPSGLQLRLCGAAYFIRDLHAMEKNAARVLPRAKIRENEMGEREIVEVTADLEDVDERTVLALLRGGETLRAAAWSEKATRR